MKLHEYFRDFLRDSVNLSEARLATLDNRVAAVATALAADSELGPLLAGDVIPQGSYAQRTIINPLKGHDYDADVLLPIIEQEDWEPNEYVPNVYGALNRNSTYSGKAGRRTRCVVVDYADPFHVDVVPYVQRASSAYITNRKTNRFELTNPEGFNSWLDEQNRLANGYLVPVIRLIKYLRDYKQTFSAKSVILTTLLGDAVTDAGLWGDATYCCDLPTALVDIVGALDDYLQRYVILPRIGDPSCPSEDFNHRWSQDEYANFRTRINGYAKVMREALAEPNLAKSLDQWRSVFGADFKKSPPATVLSQAAFAVSDPEEDLERDRKIRVTPRYKVKLVGRVERKDGFRDYALPTRMNEVAKGRSIVFTIHSCTVPGTYQVFWKVKNAGEEAARADQLRGQIFEGSGQHRERTAYRGSHYVDVYIVQNGCCVARDRQRVVVK